MELLRIVYKVKRWFVSWCYSDQETFSFASDLLGNSDVEFNWMAVVPRDVILREQIIRKQLDTVEVKYILWYPRDFYTCFPKDKKIKLFESRIINPWFWIGGKTSSGEEVDMTSQLEPYLISGNVIKPMFLSLLNPKIIKWVYLDETFNQIEFPTAGIVIKNDTFKQEASETSEKKED
jgi:hypothetical protein